MSNFEFGGSDWVSSHFGCLFGDDGSADVDVACEDVMIGADADASRRPHHSKWGRRGQSHQKALPKKSRRSLFGEDETDADVVGVYGTLSGVEFGMVEDDVYASLVEAEATDPYALGM